MVVFFWSYQLLLKNNSFGVAKYWCCNSIIPSPFITETTSVKTDCPSFIQIFKQSLCRKGTINAWLFPFIYLFSYKFFNVFYLFKSWFRKWQFSRKWNISPKFSKPIGTNFFLLLTYLFLNLRYTFCYIAFFYFLHYFLDLLPFLWIILPKVYFISLFKYLDIDLLCCSFGNFILLF